MSEFNRLAALIKRAADQGVYLYTEQDKLKFRLSVEPFPAELKAEILAQKAALIAFLQAQQTPAQGRGSVTPRAADVTPIPTSFAQQRLWLVDQLQGGSVEYHMPMAFSIKGHFDLAVANQAINTIVARHESLRTRFVVGDGGAEQVIDPNSLINIECFDLTAFASDAKPQQLNLHIQQTCFDRFDLAQDALLRVVYLALNKPDPQGQSDGDILLFNMHHIISDGWSMAVLIKEFLTLYSAFSQHQPNPLPPLKVQYADYALWQHQWLSGEVLEKQQQYWAKQLEDLPAVHPLQLDKPRDHSSGRLAQTVSLSLGARQAQSLLSLANAHRMTPFMLLHAALALVISNHGDSGDIVLGSPVANRLQNELKPLIGFFVNTLVLRVNTRQTNLGEYLAHVRQVNLDAQSHQDIPFEQLVELCAAQRSEEYSPLFQILFSLNNTQSAQSEPQSLPGVQFSRFGLGPSKAKFELDISAHLDEQGLSMAWTYDTGLFDKARVTTLAEHMMTLLGSMAQALNAPKTPLSQLNMLLETEREFLLNEVNHKVNQGAADYQGQLLHQLVEQTAEARPNALAVVFEQQRLSYGELNAKANQMAAKLVSMGVKPDSVVAICTERSAQMIVAILAVLKAGGAYLPLDPALPDVRRKFMIDDCGATILLCQKPLMSHFDGVAISLLDIEDDALYSKYSDANLDPAQLGIKLNHLAYIIYTSGSTGQPKGVMIEHQAIASHICVWREYLELNSSDHIIQFASISFDGAPESIFSTLYAGAAMYVRTQQVWSVDGFYRFCKDNQITLADLPPAYCLQLLHQPTAEVEAFWANPPLRTLVLGGDALNREILAQWQRLKPTCRLVNAYGPTEATVTATTVELVEHNPELPIPIGSALKLRSLYVLDSQKQLMPKGAIGELCIGGECLARGYLNCPELTAEQFIDNPFGEGKLYRTGDRVRWMANGQLAFLGRTDAQVKVRGFRIEPGEVQKAISQCQGVASNVVVVTKDNQDQNQLVAYVLFESGLGAALGLAGLKRQLSEALPKQMIPAAIVEVQKWPLTMQGKIDKNALAAVDFAALAGDYVAPSTDNEQQLAQIWAEVLNVPLDKVGVKNDFFDLGGHSLLLVQLVAKIERQFALRFDLRQLYQAPTIAEQAGLMSLYLEQASQGVEDNFETLEF